MSDQKEMIEALNRHTDALNRQQADERANRVVKMFAQRRQWFKANPILPKAEAQKLVQMSSKTFRKYCQELSLDPDRLRKTDIELLARRQSEKRVRPDVSNRLKREHAKAQKKRRKNIS